MTADDAAAPARILLAAGEPEAAQFVQRVLGRGAGFDVRLAGDAVEALHQAGAESWDLVITDADLPGMTGTELLERLRQISRATPVVVVTARGTEDGHDGVPPPGADAYLRKPFRPGQLIAAAIALVRQGRAARLAGREVVLAIGAHPDDAEIGAGGTLLAHHAAGHQVAILTMTGGRAGGGQGGRRPEESAAGARILGADLYLEDLGDAMISEGDPTITAMRRVMDRVGPTILYTHSIHDEQQDHRNTHRAALIAGRGIGRVYCFQSPSATAEFGPSLFVGIDAQLPGKLAAVAALGSRVLARDHRRPDLITSTARHWGRFARAGYAEAFEVVRDRAVRSGREPDAPS
jgi:LmbE family N-acetylglucosaminyl deacetylase/CheY-like chemotaxis protein